jgi:hypothetical protein
MPISASASRITWLASARVWPSARLNETVVASSVSWWLIAVGVARSRKRATAVSGTSVVTLLLSALPVDASRAPGLALSVVAAVVTVAAAADAAVAAPGAFATDVPAPGLAGT